MDNRETQVIEKMEETINYVLCTYFLFCLPSFCVLCPMYLVSLYCPFLIVSSIFSIDRETQTIEKMEETIKNGQ
jgi:hypothetical protein